MTDFDYSLPTIILVRPQMGENIGATARSMANFGFQNLILVDPRDGWPNEAAITNSVGAFDLMEEVKIFKTLEEALQPFHYVYATTARPRDMRKEVLSPSQAASGMQQRLSSSEKIALLFGAERTGLTNDEINLASSIITYPVNPAFSSLNLAQSVLLLCYEIARTLHDEQPAFIPMGDNTPGTQEELNNLIKRLDKELEDSGFFRCPETKNTLMQDIRAPYARANLTAQEIKTIHGIITSLTNKTNKA